MRESLFYWASETRFVDLNKYKNFWIETRQDTWLIFAEDERGGITTFSEHSKRSEAVSELKGIFYTANK